MDFWGEARDWAPIVVAVAALVFAIGSFWWMNARTGRLTVQGAPVSYAATTQRERLILLFPFVFINTGPVPYVVRDLRLRFRDETDGDPLSFERIRTGISPRRTDLEDLSAAFPVRGREAVRVFCEFQRTPVGRSMAGRHPLALEALTDKDDGWRVLLVFDLNVDSDTEAKMGTTFISFRNRS